MGRKDSEELRAAMNRNVLEVLPLATGGLAALYLALTLAHGVMLRGEVRVFMLAAAVLSTCAFFVLWSMSRRGRIPARHAQWTAFVLLMVVLANCSLHLTMTRDAILSTNFILLSIGAGCLLLSARWLGVTLLAVWGVWWLATRTVTNPTLLLHGGVGMGIGTVLSVLIHLSRQRRFSAYEALLAGQREMSERLQAALTALEAANRAKGEFLANMSHEIRTPMNALIGMADLLIETPLDPRQGEYVRALQRSAESLLHLLTGVLDLSRADAGDLELRLSDVDLQRLVAGAVDVASAEAVSKGLGLEWRAEGAWPVAVRTDEHRLRLILLHLLNNAVKFTDTGGVLLRVRMRPRLPSGGWWARFEIEDTGIGIPSEVHGRLFEPFMQVDGSTIRRHGGSGLGLALCRQWVERMGGTIGLTSEEGKGSEFWFEIPMEPSVPPAVDAGTRAAVRAEDFRRLSVLVAEDNAVNQLFARRVLESLGHAVEVVADGRQAIHRAEGAAFDVILMDCQMPEVDGYEASRQLRTRLGTRCPRIIAVTAHALPGERERCLTAGMDDFLVKPLRKAELAAALNWSDRL